MAVGVFPSLSLNIPAFDRKRLFLPHTALKVPAPVEISPFLDYG